MKLGLALAASLLLAPCAAEQQQQQPIRVSPAASKSLGSPEDACRAAPAEVPSFPDGGVLSEQLPDLPTEPVAERTPRPVFQGKPLLPPERPGESASELQGCLAAPDATAAAGARFPVVSDQPLDGVRVNPLSSGLLVTHELAHPCCVRAAVSAQVEGSTVRVTETLSGTPCECRCASRLRTAVGLAPGRYSLAVVVRGPASEERTAYSGPVTLPGR